MKLKFLNPNYIEGGEQSKYLEIPLSQELQIASSSILGGIKTGYSQNNKNYPIKVDSSGNAFCTVNWTDTNTTYSNATSSNSGLMSAADKNLLDVYNSYQTISSLSNISANKAILYLSTSSSQSLSISSFPTNCISISIFIYNASSNTITMTIPSNSTYIAMNGTSLSISGNSGRDWGEINIVKINNKYLIRIGGYDS